MGNTMIQLKCSTTFADIRLSTAMPAHSFCKHAACLLQGTTLGDSHHLTLTQETEDLRTCTDAGSCGMASSLSSSSPSRMRPDSASSRQSMHFCTSWHKIFAPTTHQIWLCSQKDSDRPSDASMSHFSCHMHPPVNPVAPQAHYHLTPPSPPAAALWRALLLEGCSISPSSPIPDSSMELASSSKVLSACRGRLRLVPSVSSAEITQMSFSVGGLGCMFEEL